MTTPATRAQAEQVLQAILEEWAPSSYELMVDDDLVGQLVDAIAAALTAEAEHRERLRAALVEVLCDTPSTRANVDEHHRLQQLHRRMIALLGTPDPGEYVRSDYWLTLAAALGEEAGR